MFCLRWIVDRQTERLISHLMKVNCSPYMLVSRARLGYFPNGGTIRLNTRAIHTNTAGRTIWKKKPSWHMIEIVRKILPGWCKAERPTLTSCLFTVRVYENIIRIPEQRSLSWSAEHRGIVSRAVQRTAVSSDSSLWPGMNLCHLFHWASRSHGILDTDTTIHMSKLATW